MQTIQQEIDERTNLTSSNKLELLLFRLGNDPQLNRTELFGINVFKVREIIPMPTITAVAGSQPHMMGVVDLRGQILPVIDLAGVAGCTPSTGLNILLITEYARSTQAFAVESVDDIVRLDWKQVLSAEGNAAGGMVTSIARLDGDKSDRLAQVLDVETILRQVMPSNELEIDPERIGPKVEIKPGSVILAADDSLVARTMIEEGLTAMGLPYIMCKTGKEAWDQLQALSSKAQDDGHAIGDKVALVLTDLEMPEMDGFTLTRNIKQDPRFSSIPVVIHSSLTGAANEAHVKKVGADGYVAKFVAEDLAQALRHALRSND
ncbi:MAG: chemotaxis protein [Thiobacillus sp.]|nr:chemotaxis protein [Gammaproteobacteria bacterium]MDO9007827.1 chemotaxis protein [Thiobacillus sp.]MDP1925587.1 chemotaxis protein [Thiobacillus sp.]MDP3124537.1 chemotaxis protein [Thiobacillus sp.]OGU22285.1 MAG: chemotaxis protein CheV [Hydrogenophilales bacterium RIFOXYD1_FULL_62_11]